MDITENKKSTLSGDKKFLLPKMPKALLIAEKPDLMRKIQEVYEKHKGELPYEIDFESQRGHLLTLKTPDKLDPELKKWTWETLPIEPENYGGFQYEVIKEKRTGSFLTSEERYTQIMKKLKSGEYTFVINAGDPDQEGELLIRIVLKQMKNTLPVKRFWTNDLTKGHIFKALQNLRDDDHDEQLVHLLDAAYCRQHSDWRVGMNLSRAATMKMNTRVACGRVKTPILSIVCKREEEIRGFVPKTVYGIKAVYAEGFDGTLFVKPEAEDLPDEEDEEEEKARGVVWFETKKEADDLIAGLSKTATVTEYTAKREESYAPKLFKLATAQKEAGRLGYSAADTQRIIQGLYEKKIMSYPRTSCEYVHSDEDFHAMLASAAKVPELAPYVAQIQDPDIARVKTTKTWVNDKVANDEGHTALVPTTQAPDWDSLDKEERDIYTMIAKQFVAAFLPPLVQDKAVIVTIADGNTFRSSGKTMVDPGYTKIFGRSFTDTQIPPHSEGDVLGVDRYENTDKTSVCPKRYTTPDLIAVCESPAKFLLDQSFKKLGKRLKIGTPATRSGIIEELITDKYLEVRKEGKRTVVAPTKTGEDIIGNLRTCAICRVDLTGEWEEKLEKVRRGEMTLLTFETEMRANVKEQIDEIRAMEMATLSGEQAGQYKELCTCPKCGKKIMRGPKKFYCTGYKEGCSVGGFAERNEAILTNDEFMTLLTNGGSVKKKMTRNGITWEQEIRLDEKGTITYPVSAADSGYTCPVCGKPIAESPTVFACTGRKDKSCDFSLNKVIGGKAIPKEQFDKLFTEGKTDVIEGFYSEKKKKNYDASLEYDSAEKKVVMRLGHAEKSTDYKCPVCGKLLVKNGYKLLCECGFYAWTIASQKPISEKNLLLLFSKGETDYIKMKSKKGKQFEAKIVIDKKEKKTSFRFKN